MIKMTKTQKSSCAGLGRLSKAMTCKLKMKMSININIFETTVNKTVLKTQYLKHRDITSNLKM